MPVFLARDTGGDRHLIPRGQPLLVGRGGGSQPVDLTLDDDRVSRVHLSVQEVSGHIVATDLDSSNGTIINGVATTGSVTVLPGSRIEVGGTTLMLIEDDRGDLATEVGAPPASESAALVDPLFQAFVDEAVHASGASTGWLLAIEGRHLAVLAATSGGSARAGQSIAIDGARGLALASGQASAQMPTASDTKNDGAGAAVGVPRSLLACPCGDDDIVGVLEVAGKQDGGSFSFDDVELVSSLATIAGVAIAQRAGTSDDVSPPSQIAGEITALAEADPGLYRDVVRIVEALIGQR